MNIDRDAYLRYALSLKPEEIVTRDLLTSWLPSSIIDCHAHATLKEHVKSMAEQAYNHMLSTFPYFSIKESAELRNLLFPLTKVRSLRFPKTFRGVDHRAANNYLLRESPEEDRIAVYGLPDDVEYTCKMLGHPRASALKMYHSYSIPPATQIYSYFPPLVLEVAQEYDKPIILHPPLIVTQCLDQVVRLLEDFPHLPVVLAHLGLTKTVVPGLEEAYRELSQYPHIRLDTSLVPSAEVVKLAIEVFGWKRILFGSDEPLNLIRAKLYVHPQLGQRLITEFPYHWVNKDEHRQYRHLAQGVVHSHWQCMIALKEAVDSLPEEDQQNAKDAILRGNAESLFGF